MHNIYSFDLIRIDSILLYVILFYLLSFVLDIL